MYNIYPKEPFSVSCFIWARSWENLFMPYVYNKGTDQPAHPSDQSLLCAKWVAKDLRFLHEDSRDTDQTWRCPGCSESSLGAQVILFILSCCSSFQKLYLHWGWNTIPESESHRAIFWSSFGPCHKKTCLCHMRTTKVQISLRICTVWSAPLLFAS